MICYYYSIVFQSPKKALILIEIIYFSFENNPSKLGGKINELKTKFDSARSILSTMPGIDMSYTEQQEYYESLLKQYKNEKERLESYKEMCKHIDISDLEKGPTESFLNNNQIIPVDDAETADKIVEDFKELASFDTNFDDAQPIMPLKEENTFMEMDQTPHI